MADELVLHNFIATAPIKAGQAVANVASNDPLAPKCQPAGLTVEKIQVLGISLKDVPAGEAVTIEPLVTGKIVQLRAGGAVTAGVPVGFDANGDFVDAGSGTAAAPIFSINSAAAAGDMFLGVIVHTCGLL